MKFSFQLLWLAVWLVILAPVSGADLATPWTIESLTPGGRVGFQMDTGRMTATNGVIVRYLDAVRGTTELTAQRVSLNQGTGEIEAEGGVILKREEHIWRSEYLKYNFKTHDIQASEFKTSKAPFYVGGMSLSTQQSNNTYSATNAFFTTDDIAEPGYTIRCRKLTIIPGERIEAEDATVYLGNTPVFYWPKYTRSLQSHPNFLVTAPGYRSVFGPYLLSAYHMNLRTNFEAVVRLDYRQTRGPGVGPEVYYDFGKWGRGDVEFYYTHDDRPGTNALGASLPANRTRLNFAHSIQLNSNLTAQAVIRQQGDPNVVHDFFEAEFQRNIQPASFVEVNRLWPNFSLSILAEPRINTFFETVERLPDVKLSGLPQQIGVTPLYYESDSSMGFYRHTFASGVSNSFSAWRGDSFHQITLPENYFGWLNVTPRVGGRLTHYGESDGLAVNTAEQNRWVFNTGAEVSTKASQVWPQAKSKFWDVDGVRHIIEPSVNYVYVPSPNRTPQQLPQFDGELPSLRLLPIEYPDYNAIDSVDSQNVVRLGLRNKLQTKRGEQLDNLVNWALYTDWRLQPRAGQTTFADVYSDLDFKPRSWLTFTSENRFRINSGEWQLADHNMTVEPGSRWSFTLGHRYLRSDPTLGTNGFGNNLIRSVVHYRLNENWGMRTAHQFEARDGTLEEQSYSLYHDFRSWTGALTVRLRDNRTSRDDFTIGVTFSLKATPHFKLNHDRETPSLLLGY